MNKELFADRNAVYGPSVADALEKRGFAAYYCATKEEAVAQAMQLIPKDHVVGWGGSITLTEIGLQDKLKAAGYAVLDRDTAKTPEERTKIMRRIIAEADTFITSSNAVTEDGQLLNVDGNGNRVAAITYGPSNVVVVVGVNKLVRNMSDAEKRIRMVAAPTNAQRFAINTHCKITGRCNECTSPDCICVHWVKTRVCRPVGRIKVIIVGEELGF